MMNLLIFAVVFGLVMFTSNVALLYITYRHMNKMMGDMMETMVDKMYEEKIIKKIIQGNKKLITYMAENDN